jgi:two-component system, OmpR family, response regulator RegX3
MAGGLLLPVPLEIQYRGEAMRIAILEDDPSQLELLSHWLRLAGHDAHPFEQGAPLLRTLEHETFDVLLLDWNVPDVSGIEVLNRVRQQLRSRIPVLFGTARNAEADIVAALRAGADDYLVKPLRRMELLARLEAVTRRNAVETSQVEKLEVDVFRVDCEARKLLRDNQPLELTAKDFDLAVFFLRNIGRLLSRGHIRERVWSTSQAVSSRTLDTHVSRIRNKLGLTPEHGWRLTAVYGHGYRLEQLTMATASRVRNADLAISAAVATQSLVPANT